MALRLLGHVCDWHATTDCRVVGGIQLVQVPRCRLPRRHPASGALHRVELPIPAIGASGHSQAFEVQRQLREHVEGPIIETLRTEHPHHRRWREASRTLRPLAPRSVFCWPIATSPTELRLPAPPARALSIGTSDSLGSQVAHGGLINEDELLAVELIGGDIVDLRAIPLHASRQTSAEIALAPLARLAC